MFATTYSARDIGTLERVTATTLNFVVQPWATGEEPPVNLGALAYDAHDHLLYMTTAPTNPGLEAIVNVDSATPAVVVRCSTPVPE